MSFNDPVISVIVPCYNQGRYIHEALDSVLNQTFQDFEIIVVNDGSTEPLTIDILRNLDKPKTRVITTVNQGVSLARNNGIQCSQGKYILPLDADDKIGKTYLEKSAQLLEENENIGIVYCDGEFFGSETGIILNSEYKFPDFLLANTIFCSAFFRKDDWIKVEGYSPHLKFFEDFDFWLSLIELGRDVIKIPEILFYYRRHENSTTVKSTLEDQTEGYVQVFRNHQQLYADNVDAIIRYILELKYQLGQVESSRLWKLRNQLRKFL
jgi:glycosyltransferase involved in cell wall biosynthesis